MSISSYGRLLLLMAKRIHRKKKLGQRSPNLHNNGGHLGFFKVCRLRLFSISKIHFLKVSLHLLVLKDHQNVIIELFKKFCGEKGQNLTKILENCDFSRKKCWKFNFFFTMKKKKGNFFFQKKKRLYYDICHIKESICANFRGYSTYRSHVATRNWPKIGILRKTALKFVYFMAFSGAPMFKKDKKYFFWTF